jgi:hypothetical protein
MTLPRHSRACSGHPRLSAWLWRKDVDARDEREQEGVVGVKDIRQ